MSSQTGSKKKRKTDEEYSSHPPAKKNRKELQLIQTSAELEIKEERNSTDSQDGLPAENLLSSNPIGGEKQPKIEPIHHSQKSLATRLSMAKGNRRVSDAPCGIIRQIVLQNFQCHDHTKIEFNGRTTFISGQNGSGKSAILTALVLGLGGGLARLMGRGRTAARTYVQTGKPSALISIKLSNDGAEAFKPELYGKSITVERRITVAGTGGYALKNETGKVVSEKKEELIRMLEKFNVQIENPVNILSQDIAKTFLYKLDASDLYSIYNTATRLDFMQEQFRIVQDNVEGLKDKTRIKQEEVDRLDAAIVTIKEGIDAHKKLSKHRELVDFHSREMAWAVVRDKEIEIANLESGLERQREELESCTGKVDDDKGTKDRIAEELTSLKTKLDNIAEETNKMEKIVEEKRKEKDKKTDAVAHQQESMQRIEVEIRRKKRNMDQVTKQIKEAAEKQEQQEAKAREIARLEEEKAELERRQAETRGKGETFRNEQEGWDSKVLEVKQELNVLSGDATRLEANLSRLKNEERDVKTAGAIS